MATELARIIFYFICACFIAFGVALVYSIFEPQFGATLTLYCMNTLFYTGKLLWPVLNGVMLLGLLFIILKPFRKIFTKQPKTN